MNIELGFSYLIPSDVDLKKWCDDYGLEVFEAKCTRCSTLLIVDIPFASKNRRGLMSKPCKCGNSDIPFSYVNLDFIS